MTTVPLDKDRIDAEAERLWPTVREYSAEQSRPVFSVKELDAYSASAFTRGAQWATSQQGPIADAQVEAVAIFNFFGEVNDDTRASWEYVSDYDKETRREEARGALEAARDAGLEAARNAS